MATKAELKARLTLDKSLFDRGISAAQSSVSRLSAGTVAAGQLMADGIELAVSSVIHLAEAFAEGTKKAFDLGGSLKNMSNISGRSVKEILLMKRVLQDAGVSMEKIDRYILTGKDRGNVIGRVLQQSTRKDWQDAAESVGQQANILNKNAEAFKRVSDLMGRSGDKLTGFFVGVAAHVAETLLPLLEKFDKMDFSAFGKRLGDGLTKGADALVGLFANPALLFNTATKYFKASILGVGNVLIAVFQSGLQFFRDGFATAFEGLEDLMSGTMMRAFIKPIAFLRAGIAEATGEGGGSQKAIEFQIKTKEWIRDNLGKNMSGGLNFYGKGTQRDIDKLQASLIKAPTFQSRYEKAQVQVGAEAQKMLAAAGPTISAGISQGLASLKNFKVNDVLGAGAAFAGANANVTKAAPIGARILEKASQLDPMGFAAMALANRRGGKAPEDRSDDPFGFTAMSAANRRGSSGMFGMGGGPLSIGGGIGIGIGGGGGIGGAAYGQTGNIWAPGSYLNPVAAKKDAGTEIVEGVKGTNSKLDKIIEIWNQ